MNREEENLAKWLKKPLPSAEQTELASKQVFDRILLGEAEDRQYPPSTYGDEDSLDWKRWRLCLAIAAAAAMVIFFFVAGYRNNRRATRIEAIATIEDSGNQVANGETVQSAAAEGMMLALVDGSHVEVRTDSELRCERANDGIRINLSHGGVIVTAAKRRGGHLYVQTRDVLVTVSGTIFFVGAAEEGSRVAVMEGQIQVQQNGILKTLGAGEQLSSNPAMSAMPIAEEIAWSQNALASLPASVKAFTPTLQNAPAATPHNPEFAAASIKLMAPGTAIPGDAFGIACRGIDGRQRVIVLALERPGAAPGSSMNEVDAPQGRCIGKGILLSTLIELAYGIRPRFVTAFPNWAGQTGSGPVIARSDAVVFPQRTAFQIDAVADDPATVNVDQLKQMLQTMLATRFRLQVHREKRESRGYALVIAKNGPKLKEITGDSDGLLILANAKSTISQLTARLIDILDMPIVDRTGLKGLYEYQLQLPSRGARRGSSPVQTAPDLSDSAAEVFSALESQLGLRLQAEKAVSYDVLVIDHVELPTEN